MSGVLPEVKVLVNSETFDRIIEGVAIPDNREERFREIAQAMLEGTTEYEWAEIPVAARGALVDWVEQLFHWAVKQQ